MKDQRNRVRKQLARYLDGVDDEFLEVLGPLIVRIIAVAQRFFATPGDTVLDVSL